MAVPVLEYLQYLLDHAPDDLIRRAVAERIEDYKRSPQFTEYLTGLKNGKRQD